MLTIFHVSHSIRWVLLLSLFYRGGGGSRLKEVKKLAQEYKFSEVWSQQVSSVRKSSSEILLGRISNRKSLSLDKRALVTA